MKGTRNIISGCRHQCSYCWARDRAEQLRDHAARYKDGFVPCFNKAELGKNYGKDKTWFIGDMGDSWGRWVPANRILDMLDDAKRADSSVTILFLTKNSLRYYEFFPLFQPNFVAGFTLETNRVYGPEISRASSVEERYIAMRDLEYPRKFVSIEPIMDFDPDVFVGWLAEIAPIRVSVGYDNHNKGLVEPPLEKTVDLIDVLKSFMQVDIKDTLFVTLMPAMKERLGIVEEEPSCEHTKKTRKQSVLKV